MQIDNMVLLVDEGEQNAEQNHSRETTYWTKSSHCISEDAKGVAWFTSAQGQQSTGWKADIQRQRQH